MQAERRGLMDGQTLILIELLLVFGLVFGWGVWELRKLRREREADAAKPPSDPDPGTTS